MKYILIFVAIFAITNINAQIRKDVDQIEREAEARSQAIQKMALLEDQTLKEAGGKIMALKMAVSEIRFGVAGTGEVTIFWGDGTNNAYTLNPFENELDMQTFYKKYSNSATRTIKIIGGNVTHLKFEPIDFNENPSLITNLDVSKNTVLTYLYCVGIGISNLDVRNNAALTYLECGSNTLTNLDISKNTSLSHLGCGFNQLTILDISNNAALISLDCSNGRNQSRNLKNKINSLDVGNNYALAYLRCGDNKITNLDVKKNKALKHLECGDNPISNLDVSSNVALEELYCGNFFGGGQLTKLDVSKNASLKILDCRNNLISSLGLSQNTALIILNCVGNQLRSLSVIRNISLSDLNCVGNQFTAATLNALFGTLHNNSGMSKTIFINGNPGTNACDRNIAQRKGWTVK